MAPRLACRLASSPWLARTCAVSEIIIIIAILALRAARPVKVSRAAMRPEVIAAATPYVKDWSASHERGQGAKANGPRLDLPRWLPLAANRSSVRKTCKIKAMDTSWRIKWMSIVPDTSFHCCLLARARAVFCPASHQRSRSSIAVVWTGSHTAVEEDEEERDKAR